MLGSEKKQFLSANLSWIVFDATWAISLVRVVIGAVALPVALERLDDAVAVVANEVGEVAICK